MTERRIWIFCALFATAGCGSEPVAPATDAAITDDAQCGAGASGCACRAGNTCDTGLRCEAGTCATCPAGALGCACDGGSCDGALACIMGTCAPASCTPGAVHCPCDGGACANGLVCVAGMCDACDADAVGCACVAGACHAGLVCDGLASRCRAPRTCADLVASDACAVHQTCVAASAADASCTEPTCDTGWRWSDASRTCVACASPDCAAEPSCDPTSPSSIVTTCASEHRHCGVDADGSAMCSDCLAGWADVAGTCVSGVVDCGGVTCGPSEYCDVHVAGGPACAPRPCVDPQFATPPGTPMACTRCTIDCALAGSTGHIWPFRDGFGNCVCETLAGYFLQSGGDLVPAACDADADGWVSRDVSDASISGPTADPALAANMRCDIRSVASVRLVNDVGQSLLVRSCAQGLLTDPAAACTTFPIRLLEPRRNDRPGEPGSTTATQAYAAGGRAFAAEELNALTKACVGPLGDYDGDGTPDIAEAQPTPTDTSTLGEVQRLSAFAYFVELHTMRYEPPASGTGEGVLVIAERSRCAPDFPIRYDDRLTYDGDDGSTYWRNCERRRAPGFDAASGAPGFDFAQYDCDARRGTCAAPPIPEHPTWTGPPDPAQDVVRDHGACELGTALPADGVWRGMNHHSQMRCVAAVGTPSSVLHPYDVALESFSPPRDDGTLRLVACMIEGSTPRPFGGADPVIECPPTSAEVGDVGFALVRYLPYGNRIGTSPMGTPSGTYVDYRGGCVNEDAEWPALCPAPEYERCATAPTDAFGRYRCYDVESSFLWAADDETASMPNRSSLVTADETLVPPAAPNASVWNGTSTSCM